jgi:hypothetical protein
MTQTVVGIPIKGVVQTGTPSLNTGDESPLPLAGDGSVKVSFTAAGSSAVQLNAPTISTYRYNLANLATIVGQTVEIVGSGTKTVRLITIFLSKPSAPVNVTVTRQTVKSTGGTNSTPTPTPMATSDGASTATVKLYTAAPSTGTPAGVVFADNVSTADRVADEPGSRTGQPCIVAGVGESVALAFDAITTLSGGYLEWTEV